MSISSTKEHGLVVRCDNEMEECPEIDSCENCTTISLVTNKIKNGLDSSVCPKLKLFRLSTNRLHRQKFNKNFFLGDGKARSSSFSKHRHSIIAIFMASLTKHSNVAFKEFYFSNVAFKELYFKGYFINWSIGEARNPELVWFSNPRVAKGDRTFASSKAVRYHKLQAA